MSTIRLTAAQALVRAMAAQHTQIAHVKYVTATAHRDAVG